MHQIPNIITILRILLVVPVVLALLDLRYELGLILFAVAGISDGVDGFLAKHYHWESWLGSMLDPIADKLLLVATFITLSYLGLFPLWVVALVLLRDFVIVAGATYYYHRIDHFTGEPTLVSKLNTVTQILLALLIVLAQVTTWVPASLITILIGIVAGTTIASGADYVVEWVRRAQQHGK
ncbi:CDP-alcohol phosphatidyltransferase family protein [Solemya elarraichensis gill symbiont]|uniref:CDP-diacylglycerol--glycerol-3-phosphate 3-phosphatidyltransferase n=1 Tax=Solemya elarraichensis gill symbiont TaxID=1918949 RepID=A0A1T2L926_9GAMM|nr:CDP-alcohol phosphatidyltransferase family protein [Solemya elarraichensis gill symbiont]OOZ41603.1 CDP-alcohol phosphatidyltransferase [Solemya elarraichensis gill symbiont]